VRLRWKVLAWLGASAVVVATFYVGDVLRLSREFDARVARYRADGIATTWQAFYGEGIPESENGAGALEEATREVNALAFEERQLLDLHEGEESLSEEQRREIRAGERLFRPPLARVKEGLSRPHLVLSHVVPDWSVLPVPHVEDVIGARHLIEWEWRAGLSDVSTTIRSFLDLADLWRARSALEVLLRKGTRDRGMRGIARELEVGREILESDAREWVAVLRRAEASDLLAARNAWGEERVTLIQLVEAFRRGEDPLARWEESMEEMTGKLGGRTGEDAPEGHVRRALRRVLPRRSDYAGWLARGRLYREAIGVLDAMDALERPVDEEAWRRVPVSPPRIAGVGMQWLPSLLLAMPLLQSLTSTRLARIGLEVRIRVQRGAGIPAGLEDLRDSVGAEALVDAMTGEPFSWERIDGGAVVSSRLADPGRTTRPGAYARLTGEALRRELVEDLLVWTVR
jgi:hypothetical protein